MRIRYLSALLAAALMLAPVSGALAADEDFEQMLEQVGEDYAKGYASPFLYGFGPNQNANLFSTAHIPWTGLQFGFGIKAMGTQITEEDQTFRTVLTDVDLGDFDPAFADQIGDIVMSGPTVFGDTDTNGQIQGYWNGIEVFDQETIPGLVDTRFVPMATPEFYLGGVAGFKGMVRWLPELNLGEYGKTKYMGYGLQWNANGVFKTLPVDVMVGFFNQKLKVGTLLESTGSSYHLAVSKSWPAFTLYGGYAIEDSEMDISYTYVETGQTVSFTTDGIQDNRFTVGATLDFLLKLNLEMGHGDLTTYSAGLMFGL